MEFQMRLVLSARCTEAKHDAVCIIVLVKIRILDENTVLVGGHRPLGLIVRYRYGVEIVHITVLLCFL